jgi:hypothetical protein
MGLWKFLKGIFGAKETEDCGCDTPESCPTPEVCEVEVPVVKAVETKKEVVKQEVPVKAEETKVTAKEIKAKRRRPAKKTEEVKEAVATEVVKAKPRRRRKPKAKPENGDQA